MVSRIEVLKQAVSFTAGLAAAAVGVATRKSWHLGFQKVLVSKHEHTACFGSKGVSESRTLRASCFSA